METLACYQDNEGRQGGGRNFRKESPVGISKACMEIRIFHREIQQGVDANLRRTMSYNNHLQPNASLFPQKPQYTTFCNKPQNWWGCLMGISGGKSGEDMWWEYLVGISGGMS